MPSGPSDSSATSSAPQISNISDASRVVAGMRAGFRACYQRGLNRDGTLQGAVRLTIRIQASGVVETVTATSFGFPDAVVDCLLERAGKAVFDPPEGGSAVLQVPVTFVIQ